MPNAMKMSATSAAPKCQRAPPAAIAERIAQRTAISATRKISPAGDSRWLSFPVSRSIAISIQRARYQPTAAPTASPNATQSQSRPAGGPAARFSAARAIRIAGKIHKVWSCSRRARPMRLKRRKNTSAMMAA